MRVAIETFPTRLLWSPAAVLRVGCAALLLCFNGCGGGDGTSPSSSTPAQAPTPAPGATQPPAAPAALVVGTALSIDAGASGNPVGLRVARSANGDGFAVWQADDGTRRNLWANHYRAAAAAWGTPMPIEASSTDIDDFDLTADASGNAVVVWHERPDPQVCCGIVMSARFDAGALAWAAPVSLSTDGIQPRVASDATGAVLAVYVAVGGHLVRGRFFDPASGIWQAEAAIEQNNTATGFSFDPVALLDGSGNALAAWPNGRTGAGGVASNYFSRSEGAWVFQLPPNQTDLLGGVPGSFTSSGSPHNVQVAATAGGNFLLAWETTPFDDPENSSDIRIARFTSGTRTWSAAQTLVPSNGQGIQFQRVGSDGGGNALLLWTERDAMRTALKAIRVFQASCSAVQVIDSAVGGGAARADLGVDALGNAIAIWQQFEGGSPDDGSRSNIAVNRFDGAAGAWASAVFAETQPGNAIDPRASATAGQALLGWIQAEDGVNRVKALLQPLDDMTAGR